MRPGRIVEANNSAAEKLGYSYDELLEMSFYSVAGDLDSQIKKIGPIFRLRNVYN